MFDKWEDCYKSQLTISDHLRTQGMLLEGWAYVPLNSNTRCCWNPVPRQRNMASKLASNNNEGGYLKDIFFCEHVIEIEQENKHGQRTMRKRFPPTCLSDQSLKVENTSTTAAQFLLRSSSLHCQTLVNSGLFNFLFYNLAKFKYETQFPSKNAIKCSRKSFVAKDFC